MNPSSHNRGSIVVTRRLLRQVVVASVLCLAIYCYLMLGRRPGRESPLPSSFPPSSPLPVPGEDGGVEDESAAGGGGGGAGGGRPRLPPEILENRSLTEEQCRAHFPGLFAEIDDAVAKGPFSLRARNESSHLGPLVAKIKGGKLYILAYQRKVDLSKDMLQHRAATLHQIANALLTWPASSAVPDTIFAFNHHDDPLPRTWSYSRPADPALFEPDGAPQHYFAIPHFAFYAWPSPYIVSVADAAARIDALEASYDDISSPPSSPVPGSEPEPEPAPGWWAAKIPRAVWRGTTWFNNARAGRARQNLLHATRGKEAWADVAALTASASASSSSSSSSSSPAASNALPISDFCRYRYIVYTEGITYSGRLPFHQLCRSVVLTPPIAWLQPTTRLVRPLFSHALPGVERTPVPTSGTTSSSSSLWGRRRRRGKGEEGGGDSTGYDDDGFVYDDHASRYNGHNDQDRSHESNRTTTPSDSTHHHHQQRREAGSSWSDWWEKHQQPPEEEKLAPYPAPWVQAAWPRSWAPEEANAVFVAPDWSDLEATVGWLERHPAVAAGIAARQRALFAAGGYLRPAAEACYWRALVAGWARVARTEGLGWDDEEKKEEEEGKEKTDGGGDEEEEGKDYVRAIPWEEFSLFEIHK